jgi:hypothetical protein
MKPRLLVDARALEKLPFLVVSSAVAVGFVGVPDGVPLRSFLPAIKNVEQFDILGSSSLQLWDHLYKKGG